MIAHIAENDNYVARFGRHIFSELSIDCVGYNNFRYLQGSRARRKEPTYTMHFILSGKGTFHIDGRTFSLQAGDVFFCPPEVLICYYPDEDDPWEYVWFSFYGSSAGDMPRLLGLDMRRPCLKGAADDRVRARLNEFFSNTNKGANKNELRAVSAFSGIVAMLGDGNDFAMGKESPSERYVERAKEYIENNFGDPDFKIEHIARLLFLNHTYLCRLFLHETGMTMVGYLRARRLRSAKSMLAGSDESVRAIAAACGFGDYPHFCKSFVKETGYTPSEYRGKARRATPAEE